MNRKLLVTLLNKNIEELNMITDGFMEMEEYPAAIIHLAKRKTEDIQLIIDELAALKSVVNPFKTYEKTKEITSKTEIQPEIRSEEKQIYTLDELTTNENISEKLIIPLTIKTEEIVNDSKDESTEIISVVEIQNEKDVTIETNKSTEITETINNHQIKVTTDDSKKTTIADKILPQTLSRNEILYKADNSLSATIANKKITDIKQAISIGDRFRFQRELFKGNGEEMNKTLTYINQLATLNEVIAFLQSKYGWDENNETAEDFRQIVKRKFL